MSAPDAHTPAGPVRVFTEEESWDALRSERLGRLVTSVVGRIDVVPVNYLADSGRLLFRTAEGTKLVELSIENRVVFEVDHIDPGVSGWSVVVHGTARTLSTSAEIAEAEALDLVSWVPIVKYNIVEIVPTEISGRELMFGSEPEA